jgi:CheY-like chemotaxis protein
MAPQPRVTFAPSPSRATPRVLVVDDDDDSRDIYADYFRLSGWVVEDVTDGEEALAIAAMFKPDVIVMDIRMPGVDGIEATRRLKRDVRTRDVPVVCVTSHVHREFEALRAGCAAFLTKPCARATLAGVIEAILSEPATAVRA